MSLNVFKSIFLIGMTILFSSCVTYNYKTGKSKSFKPPKDLKKSYGSKFQMSSFQVENFEKGVNQTGDNLIGEYFTSASLKALSKKYKKFVVLYWNPSCNASDKVFFLAQKLHKQNSTVILLSLTYAHPSISKLIKNTYLEKKPIYILETENIDSRIVDLKKVAFAKEICPPCYETEKDDLMFYKGVLYTNESFELIRQINDDEILKALR